jgi:tetratricopeptide (TPR) repeat protein
MPSYIGYRVLLVFFLISSTIYSSGISAGEAFKENEEEILNTSIISLGEWTFSHSKTKILRNNSTSQNLALNKASFAAKIAILDSLIKNRINFKIFELDNASLRKLVKAVRYFVLENKLDLSGIQKVHSGIEDQYAHVVLALPKEKYVLPKNLSNQSIAENIIEYALKPDYSYDPFLVVELDKGKLDSQVVFSYFITFLVEKYNIEDLPAAIKKKKLKAIPDGFLVEQLMEKSKFLNLSWTSKLNYLEYFFCHPKFFYLIALDLEKNGMDEVAQLFYLIGTQLINFQGYSKKCYEALSDERYVGYIKENSGNEFLDLLKKPDNLPEKFEHKIFGKIVSSNGQFNVDSENKVNNHFLEALNFFQEQPPKVEDAIASFKKSLEENLTANTCNYLGRCYVLQNRSDIARIFFMQATRIDEKHPYAMANLAICYKSIGMDEEALRIAQEAIKGNYLDDWAVQEIKNQGLHKNQDADSDLEIEE